MSKFVVIIVTLSTLNTCIIRQDNLIRIALLAYFVYEIYMMYKLLVVLCVVLTRKVFSTNVLLLIAILYLKRCFKNLSVKRHN